MRGAGDGAAPAAAAIWPLGFSMLDVRRKWIGGMRGSMAVRAFLKSIAVVLGLALAGGPALAQDNTELLQRVERLDNQIRTLTATVEELTFRVSDLEQIIELLRADNEALYQILDAAGIDPFAIGSGEPASTPAPAAEAPAPAVEAPAPVVETPAASAPQLGAPPQNLGVVPADNDAIVPDAAVAGGPLDLARALRPDGSLNIDGAQAPVTPESTPVLAPQAAIGPQAAITGDAMTDYNAGYQLVLNGDYAEAETAFRSFLAAYPGNALAVDARFWMAESMLSRGMYREAASEFYDAYIANPNHEKAPDMLLKLGISMAALGQIESACGTFEQVLQRYPDAPNALVQRVGAEQANAGC